MTLRSRLVLALVALATAGLVVFGVATSGLYARSLANQLDIDLSDAISRYAHGCPRCDAMPCGCP